MAAPLATLARAWPAVVLFVPVAVGVFFDGGYSADARVAFGAVALAAAAAVLVGTRTRVSAVLAPPLVLVLLAVAALGALSALWTIGPPERTLRWAFVTLGYAAVAMAAAVVARRERGVEALAVGIGALAVVAGAAGLVATAAHEPPYALRIAGEWRPAGPFEYPPALALLEVSALTVLLAGVAARSRLVAAIAVSGLAIAGGVIALSASRVALAMAVAVAGIALLRRFHVSRPGSKAITRFAVPLIALAAFAAGALAFGEAAGRGAGPASGFLHGRADTWGAAIEAFADRPLRGAGADAFLVASVPHQDGHTIVFAHDLPLELAVELGIAGFLLVIALYAATARDLFRARQTAAGWLLGPAAVAFLVANLVDWPWHLAGSGAIWALGAGALAGVSSGRAKLPVGRERKL